jgi:REP element-mobilizing transposase RayT
MPSHVHLIPRAEEENPSEILRDFKAYTAKRVLEEIETHPQESRQEWMLEIFAKNKTRQFWQHHNKPIELWSDKVVNQKIYYVHMNPVRAGFVTSPEHWKYSSAKNYNGLADSQIAIDI